MTHSQQVYLFRWILRLVARIASGQLIHRWEIEALENHLDRIRIQKTTETP